MSTTFNSPVDHRIDEGSISRDSSKCSRKPKFINFVIACNKSSMMASKGDTLDFLSEIGHKQEEVETL